MRYQTGDAVFIIEVGQRTLPHVYPATVVSRRTRFRYVVRAKPPQRSSYLTTRTANGLWFRRRPGDAA